MIVMRHALLRPSPIIPLRFLLTGFLSLADTTTALVPNSLSSIETLRMPRLSDRQKALRQTKEALDCFFFLEMLDIDEDPVFLELFMLVRGCLRSQRYMERPLRYNIRAVARTM